MQSVTKLTTKQQLESAFNPFNIAFRIKCLPYQIIWVKSKQTNKIIPQIKLGVGKQINQWRFVCISVIILKILILLAVTIYDVTHQQQIGISERMQVFMLIAPMIATLPLQINLALNYQRISPLVNATIKFSTETG